MRLSSPGYFLELVYETVIKFKILDPSGEKNIADSLRHVTALGQTLHLKEMKLRQIVEML